jgi:hypothetical protein
VTVLHIVLPDIDGHFSLLLKCSILLQSFTLLAFISTLYLHRLIQDNESGPTHVFQSVSLLPVCLKFT